MLKSNKMTKEAIIAVNKELRAEMKKNMEDLRELREVQYDIRKRIDANKNRLIKFSPIQVGDKVLAKGAKIERGTLYTSPNWVNVEGFVSSIKPSVLKDTEVKFFYNINAIKKDGKMSQRLIDSYYTRGMDITQLEKL